MVRHTFVTSYKTKTCTQSMIFQLRIVKIDTKCIYRAYINNIIPYALARTCIHLRRNYEIIITVLIYHNALHAHKHFWKNYIHGFNQGHYPFYFTSRLTLWKKTCISIWLFLQNSLFGNLYLLYYIYVTYQHHFTTGT